MTKLVIRTSRERLHQELCKGLEQAIKFGNTTTLLSILKELPNGVTKSKINLWIETYSPLRFVTIKPMRLKISSDADKNYDRAILFPYWEIKLPACNSLKTDIKGELSSLLHKFISDPSDTNHKILIQVMENYKLFGNSTVKRRLKITPANLLQGGIPSLGGKN